MKNPGIAAVLSFVITGLGQIYNGRIGKGLIFVAIQSVNFLLIFVGIGLITAPLFWIYGIYDAYGEAKRINQSAGHESGNKQRISSQDQRKCPFCAELIKKEAKVCKHCGREVPEAEELCPVCDAFREKGNYKCTKCDYNYVTKSVDTKSITPGDFSF